MLRLFGLIFASFLVATASAQESLLPELIDGWEEATNAVRIAPKASEIETVVQDAWKTAAALENARDAIQFGEQNDKASKLATSFTNSAAKLNRAADVVAQRDPYAAAVFKALGRAMTLRASARNNEANELREATEQAVKETHALKLSRSDMAAALASRIETYTSQAAERYSKSFVDWQLIEIKYKLSSESFEEVAGRFLQPPSASGPKKNAARTDPLSVDKELQALKSERWTFDARDIELINSHPDHGRTSIAILDSPEGSTVLFREVDGNAEGLRQGQDGKWFIVPGRGCETLFRDFCADFVKRNSNADSRFFCVIPSRGVDLVFPSAMVNLTDAEVEKLQKGIPLAADHALTKVIRDGGTVPLVMYSHPFMHGSNEMTSIADRICFSLQRAYPEATLVRDPYSANTPARLAELGGFRPQAGSVVAVVADWTFNVEDGKVLANLKGELTSSGVAVLPLSKNSIPLWHSGMGKAVIVVTGHSDEAIANFVGILGDAGYFRGNYVIFNSCQTPLTRSLAELIGAYGAVGVSCCEGEIKASWVEDFLAEFGAIFKQRGGERLIDMIHKAAKGKLNIIWSVCDRGTGVSAPPMKCNRGWPSLAGAQGSQLPFGQRVGSSAA